MPFQNQPAPQVRSPLLRTWVASTASAGQRGCGCPAHRAATASRAQGKGRANQRAGTRRAAPVVGQVGEVDTPGQPLQQDQDMGHEVGLRFAAAHQGEYIAQQTHGTPLSLMSITCFHMAGPVRCLATALGSPRFTFRSRPKPCLGGKWHVQTAQNCPNHRSNSNLTPYA